MSAHSHNMPRTSPPSRPRLDYSIRTALKVIGFRVMGLRIGLWLGFTVMDKVMWGRRLLDPAVCVWSSHPVVYYYATASRYLC